MKFIFIALAIFFSAGSYAAPLVYTEEKPSVQVFAKEPSFVIKLKSNRTTGYSWYLIRYNSRLIEPVKQVYEPPKSQLVGAPGYEVWTFRAKPAAFIVPQQTAVTFVYVRPFENKNEAKRLVFSVTTTPT